jgi:DNA-3-methyladenine glycosylase II
MPASFEDTWRRRRARPGRPESRLRQADPLLGTAIDRVVPSLGAQRFAPSGASSHFDSIARSIVYQQLSLKAAATIYARVLGCLGGRVTAARVLDAPRARLRAAGLSGSKITYLRSLASAVAGGRLNLNATARAGDDQIVSALTAIDGIGVWTAQMFLMFRLGRLDVLPAGDAGIRNGLRLAHGLPRLPTPSEVAAAGRCWAPYRSIASLYLWALLELPRPDR